MRRASMTGDRRRFSPSSRDRREASSDCLGRRGGGIYGSGHVNTSSMEVSMEVSMGSMILKLLRFTLVLVGRNELKGIYPRVVLQ